MAYYDEENDVRVNIKSYHDWVLPKRVLASIFITGVILELLGMILLLVGGSHPSRTSSFNASGAVMLGLGACLHAIILLLCCHAYCVIYTRDKDTQTQDEDLKHTGVLKNRINEGRSFSPNISFSPRRPAADVTTELSTNLPMGQRQMFISSDRSSPSSISKEYTKAFVTESGQHPGYLSLDTHRNYDSIDSTVATSGRLYAKCRTGSQDAKVFSPIYAYVNKPPSAMKKSHYDNNIMERKRVRLSPTVHQRTLVAMAQGEPLLTKSPDSAFSRHKFPTKSDYAYIDNFKLAIDSTDSRKRSLDTRLYPDEKRRREIHSPGIVAINKYTQPEYSSVTYVSPKQNYLDKIVMENTTHSINHNPVISKMPLDSTSCSPFPCQYLDGDYSVEQSPSNINGCSSQQGVLLRPSQRRPMTFEQYSESKMSVYDNLNVPCEDKNAI